VAIKKKMVGLVWIDEYADYVESIDMIEHIPFRAVEKALLEMRRVLKKGGTLKIMTTNFDNLAQLWIDYIKGKKYTEDSYFNLQEIIYGNQQGNGEFHLSAFNPSYLNFLFNKIGFRDFKIVVYPIGCTTKPDLETQPWTKNSSMRSEMLLVIAKK